MTKRFSVTYADVVRDMTQVRIVKDGVVQNVDRALIVCGGVSREFWPRTDFEGQIISWTNEALTATDVVQDPLDAQAAMQFVVASGRWFRDNIPVNGQDFTGYWTSPPVFALNQVLLRWDTISGTLASDAQWPEATWVDAFVAGSPKVFSVFLDQTVVGVNNAQADISIALDAGGGVPDGPSTVVKSVTFRAEVTPENGVILSTVPWPLEDITLNGLAECRITMTPDLLASAYEGPNLIFQEQYATDGSDPVQFDAKLSLISGTSPQVGPPLDIDQPLSSSVSWALQAAADGEDFTGEYDLSIQGPTNTVVKRITMHSKRDDTDISDLVWTTTPVSVNEVQGGEPVGMVLVHNSDGTADLQTVAFPPPAGFPTNWHTGAPTPPDAISYEVRVDVVSGAPADVTGDDTGVWFNATSERNWNWIVGSPPADKSVTVDWSYRPVGIPSETITKRITADIVGGT